jgi:biopolymer transport protein ExbB/TolQ
MKTLRNFTQLVAVVILALAPMASAPAQVLRTEELATLIESAQTKEDHLKLAAHFEAQADELAQDAKKHEDMANRFQRKNLPAKLESTNRFMAKHCKNLARSLNEASKEARQLADGHRDMADEVAK